MKRPKVAFFDLNHTVHQMKGVTAEEITNYLKQIHSYWTPLELPEHWKTLPVWNDVPGALDQLWFWDIKCVTLSNNPINVQVEQAHNGRLHWDWMVPLESYHTYKPDVKAYNVACNLLKVAPEDSLMVTANHDFGDIEGAASIGMPSVWIDRKNEDDTYKIKNLMDLVKEME